MRTQSRIPGGWKTVISLTAILVFSGILSSLVGAPGDGKKDEPRRTAGGVLNMSQSDYNPLNRTSGRIYIDNITFSRRDSPAGLGEFLDVAFDVNNRTPDPVQLQAFVLAYVETNAVNKRMRRFIPYPSWRKHDPNKTDHFIIRAMSITPNDVDKNQVWNDKDHNYKFQQLLLKREREAPVIKLPVPRNPFPPYWKYINYLSFRPEQGLAFTLHGNRGPKVGSHIQSNYQVPTEEERAKRDFRKLYKHRYTLEHSRRKTVFRSYHYIRFKDNYKFYNMITILLFDAKTASAFQKDLNALLPKKKAVQDKRLDMEKRRSEAVKSENEDAVKKIDQEALAIRKEEEALSRELSALRVKYRPLVVQKTLRVPRLKNR